MQILAMGAGDMKQVLSPQGADNIPRAIANISAHRCMAVAVGVARRQVDSLLPMSTQRWTTHQHVKRESAMCQPQIALSIDTIAPQLCLHVT